MRPVTVDCVCIKDGKIILIKRAKNPYKGYWALPGGFVEENETVEEAIKREVKEEIGVNVKLKGIFGIYSNPGRDPRKTISITFFGEAKENPRISEEAKEVILVDINTALSLKLAFDHRRILEDYKRRVLEGKNYIILEN